MLYIAVAAVHVLVCIVLILVVLLQSGKGADLAGAFGGSSTQTAFGSRGPASFLSKLTTVSAVVFMATCLTLSLIGGGGESKSILDDTKGTSTPAPKAPAVRTETPAPTPEEIKKKQEEIERKQKEAAPQGQAPGSTKPAEKPPDKPADPPKETKKQ
jgi:preprotein translocase subunit SecG